MIRLSSDTAKEIEITTKDRKDRWLMRTQWSQDYINQKFAPREAHEWALKQKDALKAKTLVAWSWHTAHGKYIFLPYMRSVDWLHPAKDWVTEKQVDVVLVWLRKTEHSPLDYHTFLAIAEGTGLPLHSVCGAAWALSKQGHIAVTVNRVGKPCAVRAKNP
jgi:hypothetical protein